MGSSQCTHCKRNSNVGDSEIIFFYCNYKITAAEIQRLKRIMWWWWMDGAFLFIKIREMYECLVCL